MLFECILRFLFALRISNQNFELVNWRAGGLAVNYPLSIYVEEVEEMEEVTVFILIALLKKEHCIV